MAKKPVLSRKEKVMKVALAMVANGGFHGTPMAELASKSGVAVGTIYHHFASKEDLITALYKHCVANAASAVSSSVDGKGTVKEKFIRLWNALYAHQVAFKDEFAFMEQFSNSPFISSKLVEEGKKQYVAVHNFFKAAAKEGKLAKVDASLLAEYTFGTVATAARLNNASSKKSLAKKDVDTLAEMSWAAVKG